MPYILEREKATLDLRSFSVVGKESERFTLILDRTDKIKSPEYKLKREDLVRLLLTQNCDGV